MFYNTFGEKIAETEFVNDIKEGIDRKFYSYDKVREETEYLGGVKEGVQPLLFLRTGAARRNLQGWKERREMDQVLRRRLHPPGRSYKVGLRDGVWKTYNRKGNVISESAYKNGIDLKVIEENKKEGRRSQESRREEEGRRKENNPLRQRLRRQQASTTEEVK